MVRDFPFHDHENKGHFIVDQSFLRPGSNHNQANVAAIATLEAALAALKGNNVETPVNFALMISLGPHLSWLASDGLRHVESRLFSQNFKDDFLDGLRQSSHHVPCGPSHIEDRCPLYSSDSSSDHRSRRQLVDRQREGHSSNEGLFRGKRPRAGTESDKDNTPVPSQISNLKSLRISDRHEVAKYYAQRFKDLQQTACRVIAKAFIKIIEPKKQTTHPYTRGAESAPLWWPPCPPSGYKGPHPTSIRHKEPDHLHKDERVRLCVHILRAVNSRNSDRPANIKALTIRDLQRVSSDAMDLDFFSDKDGRLAASNPDKRPWIRQCLEELFYVAKQEERFIDGTLEADATVKVVHGNSASKTSEEENDGLQYDGDTRGKAPGIRISESIISSDLHQSQTSTPPAQHSDCSPPMHTGSRYNFFEEPQYQESGVKQKTVIQQQQQFMAHGYPYSGMQERQHFSAWSPNHNRTSNSYSGWTTPLPPNMMMTTSAGFAAFSTTYSPPKQPYFNQPYFNLPNLPPPSYGSTQVHPICPQSEYHSRPRPGSLGHQLPQHSLVDYLHDNSLNQVEL